MYDQDEWAPKATMADAHREWHHNTGVPMGQPGCLQDACHPLDDEEELMTEEERIKCGKCKGKHTTVNEVRNCYLGTNFKPDARASGLPKDEESEAKFFVTGAGNEYNPPKEDLKLRARYASAKLPDLKHGHYAVEVDGELKFYQIDKPQEGKWTGYTFVNVQASDELYLIRNLASRVQILEAIAEDPEAAMLRYGQEIGRCGHCNRTLTNAESRELGIGPVCRSRMEW